MSAATLAASPDALWWDTISGPSRFVREITAAMSEGSHVCLLTDGCLPWKAAFLSRIRYALLETEQDLRFIDDFERDGGDTPGEALVKYFRLETFYRASKTHADFLNERRALENCVVCAAAQEQEVPAWIKLMKAYGSLSVRDGVLLLDARSARAPAGAKNVRIMEYGSYVTEYDALMFAGLLTDDAMKDEYKRYSAAVTVSLFGTDVERTSQLAKSGGRVAQDPLERLRPLLDGGCSEDELARRLWRAQAQTLFPLIMQETQRFIESWRPQIEEAFEYASKHLPFGVQGTNGEALTSPDEMELANIKYLNRRRRNIADGGGYMLYIPDDIARERLELLYYMRNQIAHGKVCGYEYVAKLIDSADNNRNIAGRHIY
jgi:hypothetical protein